jgi:hypothetical protein
LASPGVSATETPVDQFIRAKLFEKGLSPAPPADKYALLRRATFDLIGLPPQPREGAAFLADQSPEAFDKVIERLPCFSAIRGAVGSPLGRSTWPVTLTPMGWMRTLLSGMRGGIATDVIRAFNDDKALRPVYRRAIGGRPAPEE